MAHKQTGDVLNLLELACKYREDIADDLGALASQASGGEFAALISYAVAFPERFAALVDTYDVKRYIFIIADILCLHFYFATMIIECSTSVSKFCSLQACSLQALCVYTFSSTHICINFIKSLLHEVLANVCHLHAHTSYTLLPIGNFTFQ